MSKKPIARRKKKSKKIPKKLPAFWYLLSIVFSAILLVSAFFATGAARWVGAVIFIIGCVIISITALYFYKKRNEKHFFRPKIEPKNKKANMRRVLSQPMSKQYLDSILHNEKPKENLDEYYIRRAEPLLELANECAQIINTTTDISDFFFNFNYLSTLFEELIEAEDYVDFLNKSPTEQLQEIESTKPDAIKKMLERVQQKINAESISCQDKLNNYEDMFFWIDMNKKYIPIDLHAYIQALETEIIGSLKKRVDEEVNKHEAEEIAQELMRQETLESERLALESHMARQQYALAYGYNVDEMSGHEFESFCAKLLEKNGFEDIQVTQGSGDDGIDILAVRDGVKFAIQTKRYTTNVGNDAVQQAYAGRDIYRCTAAIVLTNQYFTRSAINTAEKLGITLWDRNKLLDLANKADVIVNTR